MKDFSMFKRNTAPVCQPDNRSSRPGPAVEPLESRCLFSSWTALNPQFDIHETLQLTDGRLLSQAYYTNTWKILSPSATGSYANPTITPAANSLYTHLYYGSAVLKDGRVFVSGGEFGDGSDHIEIYDPRVNKWTPVAKPAFFTDTISDNSIKVLSDGRVLCCTGGRGEFGLYDPVKNTWTQAATFPTNWTNEMTLAMLPDGSVLALATAYSPFTGYRYVPSLNQWISAGPPPVSLNTTVGEGGPMAQLPDGKVFILGQGTTGPGHSAIYTPPTTATGAGSWKVGPSVPVTPDEYGADTPMATLPNGNVLFPMHDNASQSDKWFEYVESSNSLVTLTNVPDALSIGQTRSDVFRLLMLPTGQVLVTGVGNNQAFIFTPDGSPQSAWLPHVAKIAKNTNGSYTLAGTQLTGFSEGGVFGDDNSMSTNYPLVQLTAANGRVYYARTFNPSTTAINTGKLAETTSFYLPAKLAAGTYQLRVIASGVASAAVVFRI